MDNLLPPEGVTPTPKEQQPKKETPQRFQMVNLKEKKSPGKEKMREVIKIAQQAQAEIREREKSDPEFAKKQKKKKYQRRRLKELTERERNIAELVLSGVPQVRAYMRVYEIPPEKYNYASGHSTTLLKRPHVAAYINKRRNEYAEKYKIEQEKILQEVAQIGFSNISDYLTFDKDGVHLKNSEDLTPEQLSAISQISTSYTKAGDMNVNVKMYDKLEGLRMVGEFLETWKGKNAPTQIQVNVQPITNITQGAYDD